MKKIKFDYPYNPASLLKQTPGGKGAWGDYQFYFNNEPEEYDFWVALNDVVGEQDAKVIKDNTLLLTGEPSSIHIYNDEFAQQFKHLITCQREIKHPNPYYFEQGLPWFVYKSYDDLIKNEEVKKTKLISVVTSNKIFTEGHKKRYDFVMALKEHFGDKLDLFGRGIKDFDDKWDVLAPYKFSINIENSVYEDYFTEKLTDCYTAETFPIYYGCPNVDKYFDKDAFAQIDLNDVEKSIKIIEDIINNENFYEEHKAALRKAKMQYLNEYSLFPLVVNYIEKHKQNFNQKKEVVNLKPESFYNLNPRITVLMPLYNGEKTVKETVDSVLAQDYDRWELLVVNDNSTDNSPEIIKEYAKKEPRIRLINNKKEKGIVGALNTGMLEARGQYIARMDGDDIMLPNRLSEQLRFMDANQDVDLSGSWVHLFGALDRDVKVETDYQKIRATMLFYGAIYHPTVMLRKESFVNNNYFYDYNFQYSEDYELWNRVMDKLRFVNIPKVLLKYRIHNTNVSTVHMAVQNEGSKKTRLRLLKLTGLNPSNKDLETHEKISSWNFPKEKEFLNESWEWFTKIMGANSKTHFYLDIALTKFLVEKWIEIYNDNPYIAKGIFLEFFRYKLPKNLSSLSKIKYRTLLIYTFVKKIFRKLWAH